MTDTRALSRQLQDQVLDSVRKSQDAFVDAVRTWAVKPLEDTVKPWAEAVKKFAPQLPAVESPFPVGPGVVGALPNPAELVDDVYAFAGELLAAQKEFASKLLDVAAPLTGYDK